MGRDSGLANDSVVGYMNVKYFITFYGPRNAIWLNINNNNNIPKFIKF